MLRLSLIYAVLDRSPVVRPEHLKAAFAAWEYADVSARRNFGANLGISVADHILAALRQRGPMTRDEIRNPFHRNKSSAELDATLRLLAESGKARCSTRPAEGGKGRPAEVWEAIG